MAALAVGTGLGGLMIGFWMPSPARHGLETQRTTRASVSAVPVAVVSGVNVNLRSGPGLGYPVLARLLQGEGLQVGEERDGWYAATTGAGTAGYVFGAFLRGLRDRGRGAAVVLRPLLSDATPRVFLRPGEKVFYVRDSDGGALVVLPNAVRLRVPVDALATVD